ERRRSNEAIQCNLFQTQEWNLFHRIGRDLIQSICIAIQNSSTHPAAVSSAPILGDSWGHLSQVRRIQSASTTATKAASGWDSEDADRPALRSGSRALADLLQPPLLVDVAARRLVAEHLVRLDLVVGHRCDREVGIVISLRIVLDAQIDHAQLQIDRCPAPGLARELG